MPALSSTVRIIENRANDDTVSLAKVGQSVLHDYALTSSILKVANSAAYMGRNQVTTVSRAAVVLGYWVTGLHHHPKHLHYRQITHQFVEKQKFQ
jgi:HD-like signal output (HDOD) protein